MKMILAIAIGCLMAAFGYNERGYVAFGGETIIEVMCLIYTVMWIVNKAKGGKERNV